MGDQDRLQVFDSDCTLARRSCTDLPSEFNSGAWLVDLGVFVPTCSNSSASSNSTTKRSLPTIGRLF